MAIYMKFGDIEGEATEDNHAKWINIESFQFGVGRGVSSPVGGVHNREASAPSVSEISLTKMNDKSSLKLFTEALIGDKVAKAEIHFVNSGQPSETYIEYTLHDPLISGYSVSSGGDRPSESISINFTKIEYKGISADAKNTAGTPIVVSYDLATGKKG